MMKRNIKRILSLALVFCLVLGLTINVYATVDADGTEAVAVETAEETADAAAAAEDAEAAEADSEDTEETEAAAEEIAEETTEDDDENGISLASEDEIATVSDDDDSGTATTTSVTVYTGDTSTVTITSETELSLSGGNVTNSEGTTIATYTVASSTVTTYDSYTTGSSAASSISANSYYVIGSSSSGYLTVSSSGSLSTSTAVNEYSIWKAVSAGSGAYYLYNEATGYYLVLTSSGGPTNYSLSASTSTSSRTAFSYSNSNGFYRSVSNGQGQGSSSTNYYINGTDTSTTSGSSVYVVTLGNSSTTYVYTITFTGVTAGTGSVTINGTTYNVTAKEMKTFEASDGTEINLNYGWHIADITTTTNDDGDVSSVSVITSPDDVVDGGYDKDLYFSTDDAGTTTLNVTVYGYNLDSDGNVPDESEWVDLTMTIATGTGTIMGGRGNNEELTVGAYDEDTLYNYDYIVIVPADGYYVVDLAAACNDVWDTARTLGNTSLSGTFSSYTNALGQTEYTNVYGEGCETMGAGGTFTSDYSPTEGTSITLNMKTVLAKHYESASTLGREDPYFLLIELAEIPTPLYVEYESGDAAAYVDEAIVSTSGNDFYATSTTESSYVSFIETRESLNASDYQYTVLDPAYTTYTVDDTTYYFTGWEVTYYTEATGTYEDEDTGYIYTDTGATTYEYPTLSDAFGLSSSISYGSNASIYLFTHVKLVAQWTTVKLNDVSYVVDFGLPVSLDVAAQCSSEDTSSYTWTLTNIASYPDFGSAAISSDGTSITYTLKEVMTGSTTMTVAVQGTSGSSTITAVVNVTIYPATTVYYEEGFTTYGTTWNVTEGGSWTTTGSTGSGTQETHVANVENNTYNNYGYDEAYSDAEAASNGTQAATETANDSLSFSFTGTGVDIYANCTSETGVVLIKIMKDGTSVKVLTVDTADQGTYKSTDATSYNTPIASVTDLDYGNYTVTMYVYKAPFNFDGFRVYDTINQGEVEGDDGYTVQTTVYENDLEDYPVYTEIRDVVLTELLGEDYTVSSSITEDYVDAVTSGDTQVYTSTTGGIAVYYNYSETGSTYENWSDLVNLMDDGAKNELYLPAGVTLVLKLKGKSLKTDGDASNAREIQVGVKTTSGSSGVVNLCVDTATSSSSSNSDTSISTVDMFYVASITTSEASTVSESGDSETSYYVIISNPSSDTTISLTKLKASDDVTISDEAITEEEITALLTSADNTEAEEETAVFEPETFTVSTSVKTSSKSATVTVTAKASTDVESVTVNGTEVTSYKTVTERTGQGRNATTTTYRQFIYTETVTASGTYTYEVCAVDASGTASAAMAATATVSIRSTQTGQANQINQNKR